MKTRRALMGAALALLVLAGSPGASAQNYPERPIHMIVGVAAGNISDVAMRLIADRVEKTLGQPIVVENVSGAGSTLAAAKVAKAPADGYTLLFTNLAHAVAPALYSKLPFDAVKDFTGVATVADTRVMLVTQPGHGFTSAVDFLAEAKKQPGKYTFGSSGYGSFLHLVGESLAQTAGVKLLHVPFRGGTEAVTAVLSNNVDLAFCTVNTCAENLSTGKLKALGYIGKARHPMAPEVPTFGELGIHFDAASYNYILAPAGTPEAVLKKLHDAFNPVVTSPEIKERFMKMGLDPAPSQNPGAVTDFLKSEVARWGPLARSIGLKMD